MTPLASLLADVEANKWPQANIGSDDQINGVPIEIWRDGRNAFSGSTDAAISLCEAMLPGVPWAIGVARPDNYYAKIFADKSHPKTTISDTPARALFIATLRSLVAMEGE